MESEILREYIGQLIKEGYTSGYAYDENDNEYHWQLTINDLERSI